MIRAVLLATVAALLGACGVVQTPPTLASPSATATPRRADRLVALVGTVGAMRLVLAAPAGLLQPLAGPGLPPDAAWLSGGGQVLLATTLAGRALVGSAAPGGSGHGSVELRWQPALAGLGDAHPGRSFGVTEPGGSRLAFVDGDPGSGGHGRLVVAGGAGLEIRRFELPRPAEGAPAWLPDGRIVIVTRDAADQPAALIADPATGQLAPVRSRALQSVAIGAETAATIGHDGTVRIGTVSGWLTGASGDRLPGLAPDDVIIQAQPSVAGDEVALVLANSAGDAASIRILAAEGGWHEIARFELPHGANRAVVGWLVSP